MRVLVVLCAFCTGFTLTPWLNPSFAETPGTKIIFLAAPTETGEVHKEDGDYYNSEWVIWMKGYAPRAEIELVRIWPDYIWRTKLELIPYIESWLYFENKTLKFDDKRWTVNVLGKVDYATFNDGQLPCFGFLQYFGEISGWDNDADKIRPNYMGGYYCQYKEMDDEFIVKKLKSLGMRGYREP